MLLIAGYSAYINARNNGWLPKKSLKDEHVFITGAGSGIGRLMAIKFAEQGSKVSCTDIDFDSVQETASIIKDKGLQALAIKLDVTKQEDIVQAAQTAKGLFGAVTILVNNAGIVHGKKILDISERDLKKTFDVNALSHVMLIKEFLPDMLKLNKGHIVSISSLAGLVGVPGLGDYCGSKFAAFGIDESL